RAGDVDRVVRSQDLRQHVVHARGLEDRAHRATRDHAGTLTRRLQHDRRRAVLAKRLVGQRAVDDRYLDHRTTRLLESLADRLGDLVRLAQRDTDVAGPVADRDERGEAEAAAPLPALRGAEDGDHALGEIRLTPCAPAAALAIAAAALLAALAARPITAASTARTATSCARSATAAP